MSFFFFFITSRTTYILLWYFTYKLYLLNRSDKNRSAAVCGGCDFVSIASRDNTRFPPPRRTTANLPYDPRLVYISFLNRILLISSSPARKRSVSHNRLSFVYWFNTFLRTCLVSRSVSIGGGGCCPRLSFVLQTCI